MAPGVVPAGGPSAEVVDRLPADALPPEAALRPGVAAEVVLPVVVLAQGSVAVQDVVDLAAAAPAARRPPDVFQLVLVAVSAADGAVPRSMLQLAPRPSYPLVSASSLLVLGFAPTWSARRCRLAVGNPVSKPGHLSSPRDW